MTFLGNPCLCGWAFDQISEDYVLCERCGRSREIREDGLLVTSEPTLDVARLRTSTGKREYARIGYKINTHERMMDTLNDRRGAIAAQKAKRNKKNAHSNR